MSIMAGQLQVFETMLKAGSTPHIPRYSELPANVDPLGNDAPRAACGVRFCCGMAEVWFDTSEEGANLA